MQDALLVCSGCHRHVHGVERACPFCDAQLQARAAAPARVAFAAALLVASGAGLAACYGAPPHPQPYQRPTARPEHSERGRQTSATASQAPAPQGVTQQRPVEPE